MKRSIEENLSRISYVIAVEANDNAWHGILPSLRQLPEGAEILFLSPHALNDYDQKLLDRFRETHRDCRWILCRQGRVAQFNRGAALARKEFIWFLYDDSVLSRKLLQKISYAMDHYPQDVFYSQVRLAAASPITHLFCTLAVFIRSQLLGSPLGDQGFCLRREFFLEIGGFEDLVDNARNIGVNIRSTGAAIVKNRIRDEYF